jgi:glutaredoxin-like protein NrdH
MDKLGIRYDVVDLTQHPDKLEEFRAKGYTQAPIVTTDTKIWSGYRHEKIQSLSDYLRREEAKSDGNTR